MLSEFLDVVEQCVGGGGQEVVDLSQYAQVLTFPKG